MLISRQGTFEASDSIAILGVCTMILVIVAAPAVF